MTISAHTVPGPQQKAEPEALRSQRRTLVLFFGAFLLPVIAAYTLLATGWWTDAGSVNRGELLTPPITFDTAFHNRLFRAADTEPTSKNNDAAEPDATRASTKQPSNASKKPWVVLTAITNHCSASCQNALMLTRQTQTLLGPERHRVQLTLLHTETISPETERLIAQNFPNINLVRAQTTEEALATLRERTQLLGDQTPAQPFPVEAQKKPSQLLIIDPMGNGMLIHSVPSDQSRAIQEGKGFVKDLKRLLKYSRIG